MAINTRIERQRSALSRAALSVPARTSLLDEVITSAKTVLDYGCGRGGDVRRLLDLGVEAKGWDPYFRPDPLPRPADVVLCSYVINAIEDAAERAQVVCRAWELAQDCLVLGTRTPSDLGRLDGVGRLADGVVTRRHTFQRCFATPELTQWTSGLINERGVPAIPGVIYFFRDPSARVAFLARRHARRTGGLSATDDISGLVQWLEEYGRAPTSDEDPALAAVARRGGLTIAKSAVNPALCEAAGHRRKVDLLVVLAVEAFHGQRRIADLPVSLAADLRTFYKSFAEACRRADWLLWAVGDTDTRRRAIAGSHVGKLTPSALYVHTRAESKLPALLRVYTVCGELVSGRPRDANLVKLHHDRSAVSFLTYPSFDRVAHPRLSESLTIDLQNLRAEWRDWSQKSNRPLLHRKEEFLAADDARASLYRRLTRQEVRAGLYTQPSVIGREDGWESILSEAGFEVRGHRLIARV